VPSQLGGFVECVLEKLVAKSILLVLRKSSPVLNDKLPGLNGSQLLQTIVGVPAKNLEQGIERGR
jgi:hypothetical protein